jgi:S-adenosylmethionine hydrolase
MHRGDTGIGITLTSNMAVYTLTSDLGSSGHYPAICKAAILRADPQANIVDITHDIPLHDLLRATYAMQHACPVFPEGTVHICTIGGGGSQDRILVCHTQQQWYILPDNGLITLLFREVNFPVYTIQHHNKNSFTFPDLCTKACHAILQMDFAQEGISSAETYMVRMHILPVYTNETLRGSILYIDRYGNAVTNITRDTFQQAVQNHHFRINFSRFSPVDCLHNHYHDVPYGEVCCLFNSAGYLEIAVNCGSAAEMFGLEINGFVSIQMHEAEICLS